MEIILNSNYSGVVEELEEKIAKSLTRCGLHSESVAKENIINVKAVDTGNLLNSITHAVDPYNYAVYTGTDVKYALYVELGTYKMQARPYLKPALADHLGEYLAIIKDELES